MQCYCMVFTCHKHAYTNIILTKLHVIQIRIKSCKLDFYPDFRLIKKKKKKTACITSIFFTQKLHVIQSIIKFMQTRFLSRFLAQKEKKSSMHYFHFFFTQKLHVIQTRIKSCKLDFCPDFRLTKKKNNLHYFHFFFTQKLHVIQTRIKSCKLEFFSRSPVHKTTCIISIFHTKNCMLSTKKIDTQIRFSF